MRGLLVVRAAGRPRADWAKAFQEMARRGDDALLDNAAPSEWDEEEWNGGEPHRGLLSEKMVP